jgi:hypothetical protein
MPKLIIAVKGIIILILVASECTLISSGVSETERISAKQLQGMLGRSDVIVVDVRSNSDWDKSESKTVTLLSPNRLKDHNRMIRAKTEVFARKKRDQSSSQLMHSTGQVSMAS